MKYAFLIAALTYINETHFGYDLEFHEDEAIWIAFGHAFSRKEPTLESRNNDDNKKSKTLH